MRTVLNAMFFALLIAFCFYAYMRLPVFKNYRDCYQEAYSIYSEGEKGIVIRRFRLGEEQICAENKVVILEALQCIQAIDQKGGLGEKEKAVFKDLSQYSLSGPKNVDEMVTEHNSSCPMARTVINFKYRINTWF